MIGEKILIVDDELEICELIDSYLTKEGFQPVVANDGRSALAQVKAHSPSLVILDFNLPDIEGPDLCLEIRKQSNAPILFLSCRGDEIDKVISFSAGADDYITKPFMPAELIARIKANLRRYRMAKQNDESEVDDVIVAGDLKINAPLRKVFIKDVEVPLTAKEYDILYLLVDNPKRIFSADQLFNIVWKSSSVSGDSKTVSVHLSSLRKKLESGDVDYIINIRGIGYKFNHEIIEASK
ncbi:MAG: response regulator transcription factor [Eubacterium sp.]|nr:response regulator transcription factor [Candidatus Colimonas fimequi]